MTAPARFVVPRIPSATLSRPALVKRLDEGADSALTLLSAGPGSGKTALLAEWVATLPGAARWLTCEPEHADADRFWSDLALAIDASHLEILDSSDPRAQVSDLVDDLGHAGDPVVIVLDDFHHAAPDPADFMALLARLPARMRLVISTRADPPVPLGRLRLQGLLVELRQGDLRFTPDESQALLAGLGVVLDAGELAMLDGLTEGWTAGVQLAGLSLQANPRPVELLRSLSETNRSLVDFLMNEVIDLQPPDMREFLLLSAEIEPFDPELCDAVLGTTTSAAMLERVRASNLFLVQLDPDAPWYRYHHLFGHFLRARLKATDPGRIPAVHAAAARERERRDDLLAATRHHLQAGQTDEAYTLIRSHATSAMSLEDRALGGDVASLWLATLGEEALEHGVTKVLDCVTVLSTASRADEARLWLARVEAMAADLDAEALFMMHSVAGLVAMRAGDPETAVERSRRSIDELLRGPCDNPWRWSSPFIGVQCLVWLDDPDAAAAALAAVRSIVEQEPAIAALRVPGHSSAIAFDRGDLAEANRLAVDALRAADRLDLPVQNFGRADPLLTLAMLHLEHGELDEADAGLEAVMRVVEDGARPPLEMLVHLELAKVAAARAEGLAPALEHVASARASVPHASPRMLLHADRVTARLLLDADDIDGADALVQAMPSGPRTSLLRARVHVARGEHEDAWALLEVMEAPTPRLELERRLLMWRAAPDAPHREDVLTAAVELGLRLGFERTIVSEGPDLVEALGALRVAPALDVALDRLWHGSASAAHSLVPGGEQGLVDPLTDRELTVLRCLDSPQDSREIADRLYLSVHTVRSHVKSIYRKLGVSSRSDAVSSARALRLLPQRLSN